MKRLVSEKASSDIIQKKAIELGNRAASLAPGLVEDFLFASVSGPDGRRLSGGWMREFRVVGLDYSEEANRFFALASLE